MTLALRDPWALLVAASLLALPVSAQAQADYGTTGGASDPNAAPAPPPPPPPPPPVQAAPPPPPPVATGPAEAAPREDDGIDRGVFWIEGDFGYSYIDLTQFRTDNFVPTTEQTAGSGYTFGFGLGFRFKILTLGARGALASYENFELGTAGIDVGLRIPLPFLEPYVRAGMGYSWMGDAAYNAIDESVTEIHGFFVNAGAGIDFYLAEWISIGGGADFVFLNMSRQKASALGTVADISLEEDGDAVGYQLRFHGNVALHF